MKVAYAREQFFNNIYTDCEGYSVEKCLDGFMRINPSIGQNGEYFSLPGGDTLFGGTFIGSVYSATNGTNSNTILFTVNKRVKIKNCSVGFTYGGQLYGVLSGIQSFQAVDISSGGVSSINISLHHALEERVYLSYTVNGTRFTTDGALNGAYILSSSINYDTGTISVSFSTVVDIQPVTISFTPRGNFITRFSTSIGIGDNTRRNFTAILDRTKIAPNSVFITTVIEGVTVVAKDNGSGVISSTLPHPYNVSGIINYNTGYISIDFDIGYEPDADEEVLVSYSYALVREGSITRSGGTSTVELTLSTNLSSTERCILLATEDSIPQETLPPDVFTYNTFINYGGKIGVRSSRSWIDMDSEDYEDEYFTIRYKPGQKVFISFYAKTSNDTALMRLKAYDGTSNEIRKNITQLYPQCSGLSIVNDGGYSTVEGEITTQIKHFSFAIEAEDTAACLELSFEGSETGTFTQILYVTAMSTHIGEVEHGYTPQAMSFYAYRPVNISEYDTGKAYYSNGDSVEVRQVVGGRSGTTAINELDAPIQTLMCEENSTVTAPTIQLRGAKHIFVYSYAGNTGVTRGWISNLDYRRFTHAWSSKRVTGTVGTDGTEPNWTDETTDAEQPLRRLHIPDATQSGVTAGTLPYTWWRYKEDEMSIVQFNIGTSGSQPNWYYNSSNRVLTLNVPVSNGSATWTALSSTDYQRGMRITSYYTSLGVSSTSPHFSVNWNSSVTLNMPYASSNSVGFLRSSDYNYIYNQLSKRKTYSMVHSGSNPYVTVTDTSYTLYMPITYTGTGLMPSSTYAYIDQSLTYMKNTLTDKITEVNNKISYMQGLYTYLSGYCPGGEYCVNSPIMPRECIDGRVPYGYRSQYIGREVYPCIIDFITIKYIYRIYYYASYSCTRGYY